MRKSLLLSVLVIMGWTNSAHAANLAVITQPPTILNLVVFLLACVSALFCYHVLAAVKGGHLSKSWKFFVIGFGVLAANQLVGLLQTFEVVALPLWVSPALMVAWIGVFFYAVVDAKRILG